MRGWGTTVSTLTPSRHQRPTKDRLMRRREEVAGRRRRGGPIQIVTAAQPSIHPADRTFVTTCGPIRYRPATQTQKQRRRRIRPGFSHYLPLEKERNKKKKERRVCVFASQVEQAREKVGAPFLGRRIARARRYGGRAGTAERRGVPGPLPTTTEEEDQQRGWATRGSFPRR